MIKEYYELAKPGIVYGNTITAAAAFLFGSPGAIDWVLFFVTLIGLALIIASAAAFNNYFDRAIDAKMERTKSRPSAAGRITGRNILVYAAMLGALGATLLFWYTNLFALGVALLGWFVYVAIYTPLKRVSAHALFVGAVAGATPPVVGYAASANTLDLVALAFFAFLFVWQLPHFIAIAVHRYDEYQAAGVPLFVKNPPTARTKRLAQNVFFASLVVLLAASLVLALIGLLV